jgi:hypothetical protein
MALCRFCLFLLVGQDSNHLNATRTSVAGSGLTLPILYFLPARKKMQTSLATRTKTASFQYENWRFCYSLEFNKILPQHHNRYQSQLREPAQ